MPIFDTHAIMTRTALTATGCAPFRHAGSAWGWCWTRMRPALLPCGGRAGGTVPACVRRRGRPSGGLRRLSDDDLTELRQLLERPKVVAIGEIGLDYYWEDNPSRAFQQTVFRKQLALAAELDLPVIVHDREAHGDCLAIIKEFPTVTGVFHCFSGSPEMAAELLKRGWYLGFDGPITYKNAKRAPEVAAVTPLERIVVETDAPMKLRYPCGASGMTAAISLCDRKTGGVEGRDGGGNDPRDVGKTADSCSGFEIKTPRRKCGKAFCMQQNGFHDDAAPPSRKNTMDSTRPRSPLMRGEAGASQAAQRRRRPAR